MTIVTAPLLAAAALLALAGVGKLAHPRPAAIALRGAGLPSSTAVVQVLALGELAAGAAALVWGSVATSAVLAIAYGAFSLFTWRLLRTTGSTGSCGCFGESETPPHLVHVALNGCIAALAVSAIFTSTAPLGAVFDAGASTAAALLLAAVAIVVCTYLALTALPEVLSLAADPEAPHQDLGPTTVALSAPRIHASSATNA